MTQAIVLSNNQEDRDFLSFLLRHAGLAVVTSGDSQRVIDMVVERPVDFVLLSPADCTGLVKVVERLRAITQAPLLLLVDAPNEEQHCAFLDAGADLVLARPLSPRVLSRYVRMLLFRARAAPTTALPKIDAEGIVLDPAARTVAVAGRATQQLTQLEFRLLYVLMTNSGHVIPTDIIVERVWGYSGEGNRELVRGLIRRLRRKIEPDPEKPRYIHNLPAVGYRFSLE